MLMRAIGWPILVLSAPPPELSGAARFEPFKEFQTPRDREELGIELKELMLHKPSRIPRFALCLICTPRAAGGPGPHSVVDASRPGAMLAISAACPKYFLSARAPQGLRIQGIFVSPFQHQIRPQSCKRLAGADFVSAAEWAVGAQSTGTRIDCCLPEMWCPTFLAGLAAPPCSHVAGACLHIVWHHVPVQLIVLLLCQVWPLLLQNAAAPADWPLSYKAFEVSVGTSWSP